MFYHIRSFAVCFVCLVAGIFFSGSALAQKPKNVIIFIGDGYGIAAKTATRMALGQGQTGARYSDDQNYHLLDADKLKYSGTLTTHSMNSWITDSAPGSTVYACGKKGKVHNEAIAFNMDANIPVETILENAKKNGYAVGVVTTTRVTHATPADFTTHTWNRDLENELAAQMISSSQAQYAEIYGSLYDSAGLHWVLPEPKIGVELDVIMGGGASKFLPKSRKSAHGKILDDRGLPILDATGREKTMAGGRADEIDLVSFAEQRGFQYVNSRAALRAIDLKQFKPGSKAKVLGLFNTSHCNYEHDRQTVASHEPTLAEMTEIAIEILKRKGGDKGFFLMVEGGRIDHLEHANSGGVFMKDSIYHIGCDHEVASPDEIYKGINNDTSGNYGSDYLIKEVLAFDHAIGQGRKLLEDQNRETLIFSTSDHECGGLAVIALHDEQDLQKNGTKVRTYADAPAQARAKDAPESINPKRLTPGAAWFPEYDMYEFQGYQWPHAKSDAAHRIVISYGSNPGVNGNTPKPPHAPGNHTPQDVWVGADDNMNGKFASKIIGRGQLDNTDITPIMKEFLGLDHFTLWDPNLSLDLKAKKQDKAVKYTLTVTNNDPYPAEWVDVQINLPAKSVLLTSFSSVGVFKPTGAWSMRTLAPYQTAELDCIVLTDIAQSDAKSVSPNTNLIRSVKSTDISKAKDSDLVVDPYNKAANVFRMSYLSPEAGAAKLKVFNRQGLEVKNRKLKLVKGKNLISLKKKGLKNELYVVFVCGSNWVSDALMMNPSSF